MVVLRRQPGCRRQSVLQRVTHSAPAIIMFGFLNCHKPVGMTSRDLVNIVQKRVRPAKVGHAGTLDPLAEGVLVVGVGPAVRLVPYVQQQSKYYQARFELGASSETGDLEGELQRDPTLAQPSRKELELACQRFIGTISQVPPAYSGRQG